jgi:hypothetical protein
MRRAGTLALGLVIAAALVGVLRPRSHAMTELR